MKSIVLALAMFWAGAAQANTVKAYDLWLRYEGFEFAYTFSFPKFDCDGCQTDLLPDGEFAYLSPGDIIHFTATLETADPSEI